MASEEEIKLYKEIIAKGCCKRCALRYLDCDQNLTSFDHPEISLVNFGYMSPMEEFEAGPPNKMKKDNPCVVCLGLLQDSVIEGMLTHPKLDRASEYNHESFIAYVTFPVCALVRDYSMQIHLRRVFPQTFNVGNVFKLNTVWRCTIEKKLSKTLGKTCVGTNSNLSIHFCTEYELENEEMKEVTAFVRERSFRIPGSRHSVFDLIHTVPDDEFSKLVRVPPMVPFYEVKIKDIKIISEPVHLWGKYCKFSRALPPKPILVNMVPTSQPSVESIVIEAVKQVTKNTGDVTFRAANSDDQNYRVLGTGRTFCVSITDPRFDKFTLERCKMVEQLIRKSKVLIIKNLRQGEKKNIIDFMESEAKSPWSCKLLCILQGYKNIDYCVNAINMYRELIVMQKTPIRVIHQRQLLQKKRKLYYIKAKKVGGNLIEVDLCVSTGFYIQEFVNGDLGRTTPSISEIIKAKAELLAVDILDFQSALPCAADEADVVI